MNGPTPDVKLEHLLIHYLYGSKQIRPMFKENELYQFKDFIGYDKQRLSDMRRQKNDVSTPFDDMRIKLINNVLLYYHFMRNNNNKVMAENPDQWGKRDFKKYKKSRGFPTSTAAYNASLAGNATTPTPSVIHKEIVLNKDNIPNSLINKNSNLNGVADDDTEIYNAIHVVAADDNETTTTTTTTTPVIHTDLVSTNNVNSILDVVTAPKVVSKGLNLNSVAADDDDDNINDAKSPTGCEHLIGVLDGIEDKYY